MKPEPTKHRVQIAPSLLSANFARLEQDVQRCEAGGADILHVDVMDGHFVPNITIGPLIVAALRPITKLPLDCHLMITHPDRYIPAFAEAGADWISVHVEACPHLHRTLSLIREHKKRVGAVLNPVTPLQSVFDAAEYCDFILLMSVNPGFGGQLFIPEVVSKIAPLLALKPDLIIEIDGGVNSENAPGLIEKNAHVLVAGSSIFGQKERTTLKSDRTETYRAAINALRGH